VELCHLVISKIFAEVLGRKVLFLTVFGAVVALSILACVVLKPRYEAETLLLIGQPMREQSRESVSTGEQINQLNSLSQIAVTDSVISEAASRVGLLHLSPGETDAKNASTETTKTSEPIVIAALRRSISAKVDSKSNLLRISFRYPDPAIAAAFVNKLADALVSKQAELLGQPRALIFFQNQMRNAEDELRWASSELEKFVASNFTYSIDEQRQLLLRRANELESAMAGTRNSIAELTAEQRALSEQLSKFRPVAQSPEVSRLIENLGSRGDPTPKPPATSDAKTDPPIFLVRVYQDTMAGFVKTNTDLAGLSGLKESQTSELQKVDTELRSLVGKEAEYLRLKRKVDLASASVESYGKRAMEERVSADIANASLSNLKVAQASSVPLEPSFPKPAIIVPLGVLAGIAAGLMAVMLRARTHVGAGAFLPLRPDLVANDSEPPASNASSFSEGTAQGQVTAPKTALEGIRRLLRETAV
jgi:polysaccharide biosynthesis transport protein